MMKCIRIAFLLLILCAARGFAQNTDLQLARQFSANGEDTKALEIYQKLYRQDNDTYFTDYLNGLLKIRKFDEAESITKKMMRKYPGNLQYNIALGRVYREAGRMIRLKLFTTMY